MFIAHLPAGYLLTKYIIRYSERRSSRQKHSTFLLMVFGVLGSVTPDFDMLYFYWIDQQQTHHHLYWTHVPLFWGVSTLTALIFLKWLGLQRYSVFIWVFVLNVFLHLVLDTVVGGILWFYPTSMHLHRWIEVPAIYSWWVANFVWHWSFLLELLILYAAMIVHVRHSNVSNSSRKGVNQRVKLKGSG